ncbi:MarR family winged helix-turn-helix transcriptional regulator [Aestuariimicrobium ganziense]|uniref:MarR family winged helix-turn-helix transcriptional regulator n=1 Tax=Aestuariimicrobium ganziense TaxID=2773677 RepID=UPI00194199FE|nr:MarR family transcriptional regulator [Aestuariimicrobium ganziense]
MSTQPPDHLAWVDGWESTGSVEAMREFAQLIAKVNPAIARRAGLSASELATLELLSQEPHGPVALSRELGVTSAAASGIVDRLVSRGHAERLPHRQDGRRTVVVISESGRAEVLGHLMPMLLRMAELDAQFTEDERAVVERYVRGACDALRRLV